jgi:hypothetical protein
LPSIVVVRSVSALICVWAQFQESSSDCSADMLVTSIAGSGFGGTLGIENSPSLRTIRATHGRSRSASGRAGVNSHGKSGWSNSMPAR